MPISMQLFANAPVNSEEQVKNDPLFSIPEVAKRLGGISAWTVRAWLHQGRLRKTKVGGRTMVAESEISRFLESCSRNYNQSSPNSLRQRKGDESSVRS
jgi:excisionase family DNA binding protein